MLISVIFFGLLSWAALPAVSQSVSPGNSTEAAAAGNQSDAAEKHARRTACLKDAKSKKLVGAQKTAFLKDCMSDAPQPLTSASSVSP
jgi:Tfp pilus assembly protein PilE